MLPFSREWVSERRFPGLLSWLASIWGVATLLGALSWIAYARFDGHAFDLTRTVIVPGLWLSLLAIVATHVIARFSNVTWKAAAAYVSRFVPLAFVVLVVDVLVSFLGKGLVLRWPLTSPSGVLQTIFSFGLIVPNFLTWGESVGWIVAVAFVGWSVWQLTHVKSASLFAALGMYGAIALLVIFPSLFSWLGVSSFGWTVPSPTIFSRALVTFIHSSYWWRNSAERFLGLGGSEGEASVQGMMTVSLFLVAATWWFAWWRKERAVTWQKLTVWAHVAALGWLVGPLAIGFAWGWSRRLDLAWTLPTWLALLALLVVLASMWLAMRLQNDVTDLADDERWQRTTRLTSGAISIGDAEEEVRIWQFLALLGGWILGWPIFATVVIFFVCRWFYEGQPFRWKTIWPLNQVVLGFSGLMWAWLGWFFITQSAAIQPFGQAAPLGLWAVLVAIGSLRRHSPLTPSRIY